MIFKRELKETLLEFAKFPVVGVFGPRQSGKTILVKNAFPKHVYLNFGDPDVRLQAFKNPRKFLREHENKHGIILDEFQYVPEILSYIQLEADEKDRPGYFVVVDSQNYLKNKEVTQSLAGRHGNALRCPVSRIGILTLPPLSITELKKSNLSIGGFNPLASGVNEAIFKGGYPGLYDQAVSPAEFYSSIIQSYTQRTIQQAVSADTLITFHSFMQLCAKRIGEPLNIADLSLYCGITEKIVKRWLSVLEANYIIFFLKPYYKSFKKKLTKSSKLFFHDTGLACSLLQIKSLQELGESKFQENLFENYIIADLFKQSTGGFNPHFARGTRAQIYFWRDSNRRIDIDCLIDLGNKLIPVQIRLGQSERGSYFSDLKRWHKMAKTDPESGFVVYEGRKTLQRETGTVIGPQAAGSLVETLEKNSDIKYHNQPTTRFNPHKEEPKKEKLL